MEKQDLYVQTIKEAYPSLDIHSARLHTSEGQFNDILLKQNGKMLKRLVFGGL